MRRTILFMAITVLAATAGAHDMFLVLPDHDLPASSDVSISLYNGTFDKSENAIDRERMIDVSVVNGTAEVSHPDFSQWREDGNITVLDFQTGTPGTYVVGLSTRANMIELTGEEFNEYLQHDGVLDVLAARKEQGILDRSASERYAKHVKSIVQVGGAASESYLHRLGYPVEIIPLTNPADLRSGESLDVLVLADGEPVAGQLIYASHADFHGHDEAGGHREAVTGRTDDAGKVSVEISHSGRWYVRLIRMLPVDEEGVDYESNWATLTFEVAK